MELLSVWWVWIVLGVALGVLEVMIPGFIFLGFAIGAGVTGVLVALRVFAGNVALTVLAFAVLSVVSFLVLRRVVGVTKSQRKVWTKDINEG
jgi:membrane protein implicated in regulation of membrane protease activity